MGIAIRCAQAQDIQLIVEMVNRFAAQNIMLPRKEESVRKTLADWIVAVEASDENQAETVVGCGALVPLNDKLVEIRSVAVHENQHGQGLGSHLVLALVEEARVRGYTQACALTLRPTGIPDQQHTPDHRGRLRPGPPRRAAPSKARPSRRVDRRTRRSGCPMTRLVYSDPGWIDTVAAWLLALLWILPLAYAVWTAFHPTEFSTRFVLFAPLTLDNFSRAWAAAPFARYFLNTTILVTMILACQLVLSTLAAYAFARFEFAGKNLLFSLVLVQLMVMPDILLVENYKTMSRLGLVDTLLAIGLPYFASAFAIFLLRSYMVQLPADFEDAARVDGADELQVFWKVVLPLSWPGFLTVGLVVALGVWNEFFLATIFISKPDLFPVATSYYKFTTRFSRDWALTSAAAVMMIAPVLLMFLVLQRRFIDGLTQGGMKG